MFICHCNISNLWSCLLARRCMSSSLLMENIAPPSICDSQCPGQHDGLRPKQIYFSNKSRAADENDPVYALPSLALQLFLMDPCDQRGGKWVAEHNEGRGVRTGDLHGCRTALAPSQREPPAAKYTSCRSPGSRTALCREQNPLPFFAPLTQSQVPAVQQCLSLQSPTTSSLQAFPSLRETTVKLQRHLSIWKGTELTLPYPAGWPRAPERFLRGSGHTRKGHAERRAETGGPRHEPADQDTAEVRHSAEEGHSMAACHPGKVNFREK